MQSLERALPDRALVFAGSVDQPRAILANVIAPFLKANQGGVGRITEGVQEIVDSSQIMERPLL